MNRLRKLISSKQNTTGESSKQSKTGKTKKRQIEEENNEPDIDVTVVEETREREEDPMEKVFKYLDTRFNDLQNQISQKEPEKKKRKIETDETFNKRGHKIQTFFNNGIIEDIEEIIDEIGDADNQMSSALQNIVTKIKKRNKLIKIADSSEQGWAVVDEYQKTPIGSDSDDCKRIRQAITTVNKNKNKNKSIRTVKQSSTFTRSPQTDQFRNDGFQRGYSPTWRGQKPWDFPNIQWRTTTRRNTTCFGCGEQGHWRSTCPKLSYNEN